MTPLFAIASSSGNGSTSTNPNPNANTSSNKASTSLNDGSIPTMVVASTNGSSARDKASSKASTTTTTKAMMMEPSATMDSSRNSKSEAASAPFMVVSHLPPPPPSAAAAAPRRSSIRDTTNNTTNTHGNRSQGHNRSSLGNSSSNHQNNQNQSQSIHHPNNDNNFGTNSTSTFVMDVEQGLQRLKEEDEELRRRRHDAKNDWGVLSFRSKRRRQRRRPSTLPPATAPPTAAAGMGGSDHSAASTRTDNTTDVTSTTRSSKWLLTALIVLLGVTACAAFIGFGYTSSNNDMEGRFLSHANSITYKILSAWTTYEMFALWIHESCHKSNALNLKVDPYLDLAGHMGICSRSEFRRLYEYIQSQGVDFLSAQLLRNITHDVRDALEQEGMAYYSANYPNIYYSGITKQVVRPDGTFYLAEREDAAYYMPIHYVEPAIDNAAVVDLDKLATESANNVVIALNTNKPTLTPRLRLVQETDDTSYGVILAHPGVPTSIENVTRSNSVAQIVVRAPSFLRYALRSATKDKKVYLYDSTGVPSDVNDDDEKQPQPAFLAAVQVDGHASTPSFTELPEMDFQQIPKPSGSRLFVQEMDVAGRKWTIVMVTSSYQVDLLMVIIGGTIVLAASLFCAAWFHSHLSRITKLNRIKSASEREKAEIARVLGARERHLNEFMAHEVRNPLSSAISALSFVKSGVTEHVADPANKKSILEDVSIMDASLGFINELLRNMLDINRARSRQIRLDLIPVDIRHDVLEPVAAILFMRGAKVDIQVECPSDLAVMGDRMRLKQIVLNLSSNATKFVQKGYIRLKAVVIDGSVEFHIEDSGPGIPAEKRDRLFAKFQESLDALNQGTGIGLAVCKNLSELMGADVWLDDTFDSGIVDCPGTRFILRLNQPELEMDDQDQPQLQLMMPPVSTLTESTTQRPSSDLSGTNTNATNITTTTTIVGAPTVPASPASITNKYKLPDILRVLLVDDDQMIRKMFKRAALRMAPDWHIEEASNGETAIEMCESKTFDLIFLDQYMASVEKQLLGTETACALRANGVTTIICGLSANDKGAEFLESGADTFMMKPFPCQAEAMSRAVHEVLHCRIHCHQQYGVNPTDTSIENGGRDSVKIQAVVARSDVEMKELASKGRQPEVNSTQ